MFMMFRACQSINTRYLVKTYIWGILIYLFLRWVIRPYETELITLVTVNLFFFPFSRIFAHAIKNFFFSNTVFMFSDKGWIVYQFIRMVLLGWLYMMTPIFALIGFMVVVFSFWRMERKKKKYMHQRKQGFVRS